MSLSPLEYLYFTEDSLKELKNVNTSFKFSEPVPTLRFLYELCWVMVRGELPFQKCKVALECVEFVDYASQEELGSSLADIVTQLAQDLSLPGESRQRVNKLAKWLVESALVPLRFFQERCEEEFLWESDMIKIKAADLKSKEVRVNTRLLYQQTKFNLLREESEGYAKLVTLLCQIREGSTQNASAATVGIIKSLIGHFDLDPNRVFDIVLECFECQPGYSIFLDLIPIFPKSHASHILGFKFQYYQRLEVNDPVPSELYQLTALLVKRDFIDVDSIYAHLLPKEEDALDHYNAFSAKRLDEANKIGRINLAATGKDLMDEEKQDVTVDLYAALDVEMEAVAERSSELESSQPLGLLMGFLEVEDWSHAHELFDRLSHLNPVEHVQICDRLFRLIEKTISEPNDLVCKMQLLGSVPEVVTDYSMEVANSSSSRSYINLRKELFEMLSSVGPHLYRDTLLLQKVCRVLRGYYICAHGLVTSGQTCYISQNVTIGDRTPQMLLKDARSRIEEALGGCLLPSLQLIPANPAVGLEIWELMNLLPYEVRYRLYGEWERDDEQCPMLLAARQTAKLDTRRILKRLAKENLKQLGRMVAKLANANPMTVLRTIVHQIEAYRDMITPVVDAFKYLTQLEYDILEYVVIERLAQSGREKLKDDGLNLSDWLQSLASFWGHLCKKYPSMELRGLFQYLVNQLKKGNGIELVFMQELIQQMANVHYTENMTEEQLDAMSGSDTLRYQATSFGITRNNKALIKSTNRLRDALLPKDEPKLAIPLLLLIAQHRSLVVINAEVPYIKMVSEQFDRCHGALLQYVEFLSSAVTPTAAYAVLIPALDELVHVYHLDPEVAFLIYRPVMRLFRCQRNSDVFWPSDSDEAVSAANAEKESERSDSSAYLQDLGSSRKPISWKDLLDTIKTMLPSKAWNSLSTDLYAAFWGLTLYDLHVPKSRYEFEIAKQHAALKALEELSDNSSSAITKRKKDKERIQESLDRLTMELQRHEEHVTSVRRRLIREKDTWLSSCPDTLKINMEFLQRCIFPRCTFSMPDAVYCAVFVNTLHSLGTPFFNTVNHIDVLICKTLQPMICCCTEYEVGRLGRFLYETLKTAYCWKGDESIYERECGNMPGFAVYYRYPNSQRVTYGQFIKVHWKWSQRITRLLIQCLESTEYMEIRNALILLTKISSVFPVTRKSGINLEKRVAKIKSDEREDLKVLAAGVAAALASRKLSWVTDEEFGMGYLELKLAAPPASKSSTVNSLAIPNGSGPSVSQGEPVAQGRTVAAGRVADGKLDRPDSSLPKPDLGPVKQKGSQSINGLDVQSVLSAAPQSDTPSQKQVDESLCGPLEESTIKAASKMSGELEGRATGKRATPGTLSKQQKHDTAKDDKSGKAVGRASGAASGDVGYPSESRTSGNVNVSATVSGNGNMFSTVHKGAASLTRLVDLSNESNAELTATKFADLRVSAGNDDVNESSDVQKESSSRLVHSPRQDASKANEKVQKRSIPAEELERLNKRRKGEIDNRDIDYGDARSLERERLMDVRTADKLHPVDYDKHGSDDQILNRASEKPLDRSKDKGGERPERDHRERVDRPDRSRGDDAFEKSRDRSTERHGRERSIERVQERVADRNFDKLSKDERIKDDRTKLRHSEASVEKSHTDDRFHNQNLPPPPPLPPHMVPQSINAGRRDDDSDRRFGTARHSQRLSPRHDERERRRSEENNALSQDDLKRRREEDFRDRKREERELSMKVEEREREREKGSIVKEDMDQNASKRRKLKREHMASEPGEYSPAAHPPAISINMSQPCDGRDRGERKGVIVQQRPGYLDEPGLRIHGKESGSKAPRRDADSSMYDREWDDEKRQRAEPKRRHRK
ncbi:THO complex subunit 2 [Capsicum annuum]|uniref:THO complex subunit 2 n=1 Tax=Capsicum annuum TaxID=4072 RepID=A0A2G3ACB5_CAPAN|nr:THO complex subunit 2-like [Capsicum annuum]KAF3669942.1 THO complex subunit 2 [Capsicum annuum]PHT91840.1 THO complex subunit 2 [Capsicum annuum]